MNPAATKSELRQQLRAALRGLSAADRVAQSSAVRERLAGEMFWTNAQAILFYAPLPDEVDVWRLLETALAQGRMVALPGHEAETNSYAPCRITNLVADLRPGKFGVREPAPHCARLAISQLDLVLVPGVGFAPDGRRLGRGLGYYDRMLATACGTKCGLAFDCQVVAEIPAEPHDIKLDYVLTPTRRRP